MGRTLTRRALLLATLATTSPATALLSAQERDRPRQRLHEQSSDSAPRQDELTRAAAGVRKAWLAHDASAIVGGSGQLVVQLPGADPSAALGTRQAAALLADYLGSAREVDLDVRAAREIEPGRGYVEMLRRYRVEGTQDVRTQNLFLTYRQAQRAWVLVELRAIER